MQQIIVIGGGLSGLATAYQIQQQAQAQNLAVNVKVIEKEARFGGKAWSRQESGYLCEWGPNGFLTNKPQTLELCQSLGITGQLLPSNDNARKRFVFSRGKLHKLPHNQIEFLTNSLISFKGKLRIAAEFFVPQRHASSDETLADFTRRRLGDEALNKLIAPMAGGIFAGDPEQMSLQACFPRIYELEQGYGGLLKAMLRLTRQHNRDKKAGKVVASPSGPGGVLTSFSGGIQELISALSDAIGRDNLIQTAAVNKISQLQNGQWQVTAGNEVYAADKIVCAAPAFASAEMLHDLDANLANSLQQINYAPLIVVCLGYAQAQINADLNGFGYLFARGEDEALLGTLWDSSIFAARAPDGKVLLRSMLGGASHPQVMNLADQQIQQLVQKSLETTLGIRAVPELVKIYRHAQAIPAYALCHKDLVAKIMEQASHHPGLFITGNAYTGVGINDCVASAVATAKQVLA